MLLFLVRGCRPGKSVQMTEAEVRGLCLKSREIFLQQPILLELEAPLKICGEYLSNIRYYNFGISSHKPVGLLIVLCKFYSSVRPTNFTCVPLNLCYFSHIWTRIKECQNSFKIASLTLLMGQRNNVRWKF